MKFLGKFMKEILKLFIWFYSLLYDFDDGDKKI